MLFTPYVARLVKCDSYEWEEPEIDIIIDSRKA